MTYWQYLFLVVLGPLVVCGLSWRSMKARGLKELLIAIAVTAPIFLLLDYLAFARGYWWYNDRYLAGINYQGFPLEEVFFFIVIPFSTVMLWLFLREKQT